MVDRDHNEEYIVVIGLMHLKEGADPVRPDLINQPNNVIDSEMNIELSIPRVVALTSNSSAYLHSKDDPNTFVRESVIPYESNESDS